MVYHPCLPHLMVYHPRPPQSMLRTFLLNPFGMKIFLAQNTIYKWDWIGFFLDPSYKESIQHWLWGAGKNNFWQNLNVYLNENVFDDLIFIYRMKIHFGKDILSLIVWKIWKTKLDRLFTDTPSNDLNDSKIVIFATDFLTKWKCIGTQQFITLFYNKNTS